MWGCRRWGLGLGWGWEQAAAGFEEEGALCMHACVLMC